MNIDRYRGKNFSSIRQTVWPVERTYTNKQTNKQTHRHTYSEETEESLFYFSVVLFYILLGSKIGGFQYELVKSKHEIGENVHFAQCVLETAYFTS